ncbi:MAG: PilZ domain-containing protein [Thermodesulfobacteriota bacterium]|nr:PilZ domain-containing protein [Thermodesulfobacteriota bacterium]
MTVGANKRKMERFDLELPARVIKAEENQDSESIDLLTSDICAGGAFFQTDQPMPVGTEVKIDLVLPLDELKKIEGKKALIKVNGAVIRVTKDGMAICFEEGFEISSVLQK